MKKVGVLIGALVILSGCQTVPYQGQARNVSLKPKKAGVISIPTQYRDEDRTKAEDLMAKNCSPMAPEVVGEGEVAVGTKTSSSGKTTDREDSQTQVGSLFGIPITSGEAGGTNTNTSSVTEQMKEWHISYKCNKAVSKAL